MRTVFIAGLAPALIGGVALAADFSSPPRATTWTGFYIGVNGGYGGDEFRYPFSVGYAADGATLGGAGGTARLTASGFLGGAQAGFNWRFAPSWVGGVEADIDATSIRGRLDLKAAGAYGPVPVSAGLKGQSELPYLVTARARLGYLVDDRILVFASGGLAYADVKTSGALAGDIPDVYTRAYSLSTTKSQVGWTLGGGVEYQIGGAWTFKTEYLHVDLGSATLPGLSARFHDVPGVFDFGVKEKATDDVVRAGFNYQFR